jgi:cytochrome c-type biogenesis protein CcmH
MSLAASLAFAATDDDVRRIAKQLRCPICESVSVADSPSELAGQMRGVIRSKLEAGQTDQQILDYFVAAYGDSVLLEPPRRGLALGAWLGPAVGLLVGLAILVLLVRSWLRTPARATERPADEITAGSAEAASELERARDELERVRRSLAG